MNGEKTGLDPSLLFLLLFIPTAVGFVALWFSFPLIVDKSGGFNLLSFSILIFLCSTFILLPIYAYRHYSGNPIKRGKLQFALSYALIGLGIGLAYAYDLLLPSLVPLPWRLFILPSMTILLAFYLLRRIPKVRDEIDKLRDEW